MNLAEHKPERTFVINTGARNQTGVSNFSRTLSKALPHLKRKLVVFWLIDRKRESLELLSDFLEAIPSWSSTTTSPYSEFPARIAATAREVTNTVRAAAEGEAQAAQEETKRALAQAVRQAAVKAARDAATTHLVMWVSIAAGVVGTMMLFVGFGAASAPTERGGKAAGQIQPAAQVSCPLPPSGKRRVLLP